RQTQRRAQSEGKHLRRDFDRRGFWQGLESKRFFSQHARELQNNDIYFYMQPISSATGAHIICGHKEMIMMSSNNYLGLTTHPKVVEAAIAAIRKYGSSPSASSLLGGTLDIHLQLEEELARFKGVQAVSVFSSGYLTNVTTLSTILAKEDAVFN